MSRLLSIAILGAATLLPLSLHAQMRSMGGGPRVSSGGFRVSPGVRTAPSVPMRSGFGGPTVFRGQPGFRGQTGFGVRPAMPSNHVFFGGANGSRFRARHVFFHHHHRFFNDCFGAFSPFGCNSLLLNGSFFPFGGGNFFLGAPFLGASYPLFPEDYYVPPYGQPQAAANYSSDNSTQLAMEVQRLSDEIAEMRYDQDRQQSQFRQPAPPPPGTSLSVQQPSGPATFVFRDGHRVTAQNYAIAGDTLWILNEHTAKKVSLADLDRTATEQVNAANGIELRLPQSK